MEILGGPGGVVPDLSKLIPPPRSVHTTRLLNCKIDVGQMTENDEVVGYIIQIFDPAENHTYIYPMDNELRATLSRTLDEMAPENEGTKAVPDPDEEDEVVH